MERRILACKYDGSEALASCPKSQDKVAYHAVFLHIFMEMRIRFRDESPINPPELSTVLQQLSNANARTPMVSFFHFLPIDKAPKIGAFKVKSVFLPTCICYFKQSSPMAYTWMLVKKLTTRSSSLSQPHTLSHPFSTENVPASRNLFSVSHFEYCE